MRWYDILFCVFIFCMVVFCTNIIVDAFMNNKKNDTKIVKEYSSCYVEYSAVRRINK